MLIHLQTQITTVFVETDDDGNTVKEYPVNATLRTLSADEFMKVFDQVKGVRDKLREDLSKPIPTA
jgi:hypothetical protein